MALRAVPEHPKFARLKRTLGIPKWGALGVLETLWHFTGKFTPHGNLGKYSDAEIEAWLEWDGESGALISTLVTCGWVDADAEHRLVVHDWHQHADDATKLAVKRSNRNFVTAKSRHCGDADEGMDAKRRLPEPESDPEPEPDAEPEPEPNGLALTALELPIPGCFLTIPLNDRSEFAITEEKVREWEELYAAINVRAEIRAYKGWALNNPMKRKTRRGILASINGWLARKQDNGRTNQNGGTTSANRSQNRTNGNFEALKRSLEENPRGAGVLG
jgi:hypothetical protein